MPQRRWYTVYSEKLAFLAKEPEGYPLTGGNRDNLRVCNRYSYVGAAMIRITFSEYDIQKIKFLRYHDPRPKVRRRMEVLWLKSQGLPHHRICQLAGVSPTTLREYLRMYDAGGIDRLMEFNFYAPTSELEAHRDDLIGYFRAHPPATLNEAARKIEERTGLKRSPSAVGRFLHGLGMAPRKVGSIPSGGDPDKQEAFRIKELEPRIEEAKRGDRALFLSMQPTSSSAPSSAFSGQ